VSNIILPGPQKKKRVLIGMPTLNGVPSTKVFASYTEFLAKMAHSKRFSVNAMYIASTYLDVSREEISQAAIDENYDYLLWIDADMVFRTDILDKLYDRNKSVIGGIYSLRGGLGHGPCIYTYNKKRDDYAMFKEWPINKGVIRVDGIGTGLLLIQVEALKKIPAPRFAYLECDTPDKHGNRRRLGEDFSFCHRCMDNGIKIYADTHIWVGHVGEKVWTYRDWQIHQIIEKEGFKDLNVLTVG